MLLTPRSGCRPSSGIDQVQGDVAPAAGAGAADVQRLDAGCADPGAGAGAALQPFQPSDVLPPTANVTISNVPGPRQTLYAVGAELLNIFPVSISTHGLALNITVQSYRDQLDFGFIAGANIIPHVQSSPTCCRVNSICWSRPMLSRPRRRALRTDTGRDMVRSTPSAMMSSVQIVPAVHGALPRPACGCRIHTSRPGKDSFPPPCGGGLGRGSGKPAAAEIGCRYITTSECWIPPSPALPHKGEGAENHHLGVKPH